MTENMTDDTQDRDRFTPDPLLADGTSGLPEALDSLEGFDAAGAEEALAAPAAAESGTPEPAEAPLLSLNRRRGPALRIDWGALFGAIVLIVLIAFLLGLSTNALPVAVATWWPVAVIAVGGLWALVALAGRRPGAWIGACGLIGAGIAGLLATAFAVPFGGTAAGITLIALGTGIVLRSLLFPPAALRL